MKSIIVSFLLITLLLTGCNMPSGEQPEPSGTPDIVATEVQEMLTKIPTATNPPVSADATNTPTAPTLAPTSTLVPTFTPLPSLTVVPALTATSDPGDPASSLGNPTWTDKLDTAKNFYLYDNENNEIKVSDGGLVLINLTGIGWHGWTLTYAQSASDFYLQGLFKTEGCGGSDLYGLVFRANKENAGYFFGVTCDGQYNLFARDFDNNVVTEIREPAYNTAILTGSGQINRLGVLTSGDKISLYANGTLLEEINDGTYNQGYFGPFIAGMTENFSIRLDEISIWKQN